MPPQPVFLTGATGFLGSSLAAELLRRGHRVRALVRASSESRVPTGCEIVHGDALRGETYASNIAPAETFVHLVGVAHPSPSKTEEFRKIDLVSVREAVSAAKQAGIRHFVYLSVARPAPMMKAYQAVRAEGEAMVIASGIPATFVRPWYVSGSWKKLAAHVAAVLRDGAAVSGNARWSESARAGHAGANDADACLGSGEPTRTVTDLRAAADQAGRVCHRAPLGVALTAWPPAPSQTFRSEAAFP